MMQIEEKAINTIHKYFDGTDNEDMTCVAIYGNQARVILNALGRQIPKRANKIEQSKDGWIFYECPSCNQQHFDNHVHNYCGSCGQRLDWMKEIDEIVKREG